MTSISSKTQTFKETVVYGVDKFRLLAVLRNIWDYRLLLWIFCKRDLKGRYSQTILGLGWVILTPLITVGVFVIVFGIMIKVLPMGCLLSCSIWLRLYLGIPF